MSFIEKNKAWILPLLGVGLLGVLYLNLRPTPAASPAGAPTQGPEAAAQVAATSPSLPERPAESPGSDLWEDLRGLAAPPPFLADENGFRDLGRRSVMALLQAPGPSAALGIPSGVREPQAAADPALKSGAAPGIAPPELDFLIHGPAGARAWLNGQPYRSGEPLPGQTLSVGPIGFTSVVLKGPKGRTVLSTNPLHHPGPAPRPAVEAP